MSKTVYLGMIGDIMHPGLINIINEGAKYGDVIIGLFTDKAIATHKRLPYLNYEQRKNVIENIKGVSKIVPQDEWSYVENLKRYKPDYIIHGDDWLYGPDKYIRDEVFKVMEAQGGKCVFSSEWNTYAQKTYEANFGELPYGDITKEETKAAIPEHFDILCAGFPCQPFSIAGVSKKKSLGRETGFKDKTQGTLFFDVADIISRRRPKAFFLENVKNLLSHDRGNTFRVIRETLEELDYSIHYRVMDGQDYVPQHRERIMLVGFDRRLFHNAEKFEFPEPPKDKHVLGEILEKSPDPKYTLSDKLWNYLQNYAAKHQEKGNGFGFGMASRDGVSRTLSARYYKDGSEILIPRGKGLNPRRLTPRECARLMGYPDKYRIDVVSDVQAYRQCGNSVVVPLITAVARSLVKAMMAPDTGKEK